MKKLLAFLLFLLFIILAWFGWNWYKENILCCDDSVKIEAKEEITPNPIKYGPLVFNWNSDKAIINDLWADKKNEILSGFTADGILQITGSYFSEEINNSTFENLGLARADAVRNLLLDSLPADKMEINSKIVNYLEDAKTKPFGGTVLNWAVRNENIQEIDNVSIIYFPYNSTKKIDHVNINNYLSSIAEVLKGNNKTVTLTGHTDNIGNASFNIDLGLQRAIAMKKQLVIFGVDANRIKVASKGQDEPIATNDTEEGREKNRRVELEIK